LSAEESLSKAVKVGFPIDTANASKEVIVTRTVAPVTERSGRHKKKIEQKTENKDNYVISFINPNGTPLTLLKGTVIESAANSPEPVKIEVRNNEDQELLGSYLVETSSGEFAFLLPPAKNNNVSFSKKGFILQSENLDITDNKEHYQWLDPITLIPIERDAKITLNNLFFEQGKPVLRSTSKVELNNCVEFMRENPDLSFEIVGVAECGSKVRDNSRLCSERAEEIVKYLTENGIDKERLEAKGYALKLRKTDPSVLNQKIELRITEDESQRSRSFSTQ
jgi:outer membrane protein OmpA-like peptidoglycan-associated protein